MLCLTVSTPDSNEQIALVITDRKGMLAWLAVCLVIKELSDEM